MSTYVGLEYNIHVPTTTLHSFWGFMDFEKLRSRVKAVVEDATALGNMVDNVELARNKVQGTTDGLECMVCSEYSENFGDYIRVDLSHERRDVVKQAMRDYVGIAGVPNRIRPDSDYDLAREVLQEHGKDIKTGWIHVKFSGISVIDSVALAK